MTIDQKRSKEKIAIRQLVNDNKSYLIPFDNVMKVLLPGNNYPKFNRIKARKEFTDGFMILNCENITNSDLKTHLIKNYLDVHCVITTKTSGCKWVQLRTGHHNLGRILTNL